MDNTPPAEPSRFLAAWSRAPQLALGVFLGLSTLLLSIHAWKSLRWGVRPSELERPALAFRFDLNRAERVELMQISGIGEGLASDIISYREANGPFRSVDELKSVHGIGPATVTRVRRFLYVKEEDAGQVHVNAPAAHGQPSVALAAMSKKAPLPETPIDINRASLEELQALQSLPHMRKDLAALIVAERSKGPFKSLEDLDRRVKYVGPATIEKIRKYVKLE